MPHFITRLSALSIRFGAALFLCGLSLPPIRAAHPPLSAGEIVSVSPIRLNTVGYLPDAPKCATIAADATEFRVIRLVDGQIVLSGRLGPAMQTPKSDTDETVRLADFSTVQTPGRYVLEIPGVGRSAPFVIAPDVWDEPCTAAIRAFYFWRCGTAVQGTWQGRTYAHGPCHLADGWLDEVGGGHTRRPGTGGWHDAGDYNKYVVNAAVSVGFMLQAYEQNRTSLAALSIGLPESGRGLPDLLAEIRWELDWLFTMQQPDGRVYNKLSELNFRYWGAPDADHGPRYFAPWSSSATADFAAIMAAAPRTYQPYDAAYADRCLAAARSSWAFLVTHPANAPADLHAFHTGVYDPPDVTHRLWAAAELWATTGEAVFLREFETRARANPTFNEQGPSFGDARDLAFGTYLQSPRADGRDPALVAQLRAALLKTAAAIVAEARHNAYARPFGTAPGTWFWGCNGMIAAQTYLLQLADRVQPDLRYRETTLDALAFLFGRNYHGRSYVTGLGSHPPEHPHDRRGEPAWPGYLVGGGWPTGRDWVDDLKHYELNEIALNWNAALVYALSGFVTVPAAAPR